MTLSLMIALLFAVVVGFVTHIFTRRQFGSTNDLLNQELAKAREESATNFAAGRFDGLHRYRVARRGRGD